MISQINTLEALGSIMTMCSAWTGDPALQHGTANPWPTKICQREQNIYQYFMWFLHIDMTQEFEIQAHVRQERTYFI